MCDTSFLFAYWKGIATSPQFCLCPPSSLEMDTISSIPDAWCWYLLDEIQHSFTSSRWMFAIHILYFHCLAPSSCAIISGLLTFGLSSFSEGNSKDFFFFFHSFSDFWNRLAQKNDVRCIVRLPYYGFKYFRCALLHSDCAVRALRAIRN